MKRKEFVQKLSDYLEIENYPDFCPNGLQVEGADEVRSVATAVSANLLTIEAAIQAKVDTLVVHHGLFWNKDSYPIVDNKREKLALLLQHNINLVAYHLPLDAHPEIGNNWKAAKDLGWHNLEKASVGVKGSFPPMPIEAFVKKIEAYYDHRATCALFGKKEVESATLISGGAWSSMANHESDCFITGNFDEPAWGIAHEKKIQFLALGHSATEEIGPKALADYIKQAFNLKSQFLEIKNPF